MAQKSLLNKKLKLPNKFLSVYLQDIMKQNETFTLLSYSLSDSSLDWEHLLPVLENFSETKDKRKEKERNKRGPYKDQGWECVMNQWL